MAAYIRLILIIGSTGGLVSVSSCPSNFNVFASPGASATLQFDVNSQLTTTVSYAMRDPGGTQRAQFIMTSGQIIGVDTTSDLIFTGNTSTGEISFRLDNVRTDDSGVYMIVKSTEPYKPLLCNTLYVTGSLSVPTLIANKSPPVGESAILSCSSSSTTVPAGLPLRYTWQVDGATNPSDSSYMYSTSRDTLTISGVQKSDADKVFTCWAQEQESKITSSNSNQLNIDVHFAPTLTVSVSPNDVTECADDLTLTCNVSSNPVSNITWYRGQQQLSSTRDMNILVLRSININRTVSGMYRCQAFNGYGGVQETVNVTIKNKPDVTVTTSNVTTEDLSVDIICNPSGIPDQYIFSPWIHQWDVNGPVLDHPGLGNSRILTLTSLTYEYSGVYTCKASNGVECSIDPDAGRGRVNLVIQAPPVLLHPVSYNTDGHIRLIADINNTVYFNVTIWSNAEGTTVRCYRNINGVRIAPPVGEVTLTFVSVELPVLSTNVSTTGSLATVSLEIDKDDDFGFYDVVIANSVGTGPVLPLKIQPTESPEVPDLHSIKAWNHNMFVIWSSGFDGGLGQTIVIQTSTDMVNWQNKTKVSVGINKNIKTDVTELQDLAPSTLHFIRLFAFNDKGRNDAFSKKLNCTTEPDIPESAKTDAGVIAGVSVGVLLSVVIIELIIYMIRKFRRAKLKKDEALVMTERKRDDSITSTNTDNAVTTRENDGTDMTPRDQPNIYEQIVDTAQQDPVYTELR